MTHYASIDDTETPCGLVVADLDPDTVTDGGSEGDVDMVTCSVCRARLDAQGN